MNEFALFEARPGLAVVLLPNSPTFTVVAVSDDFVRITGRSREAVIGSGNFELFALADAYCEPGTALNVRHVFEQVLQQKLPQSITVQRYSTMIDSGNFVERYWRATTVPVLNHEGQVQYLVHTADDITAEVQVNRNERFQQGLHEAYNLFMQAPIIIGIVKGDNLTLELANKEALRFWNKSSDIIGKPLAEAIPEAVPQGTLARLNQVRQTGKAFVAKEVPIVIENNGLAEQNYFDVIYQPFSLDGSEVTDGIFAMSHNVTEQVRARHKAEQSMQEVKALVESAPFPIGVYVGREMRIELANRSLTDVWGKGDDVVGKRYAEVLPELENQNIYEQLDRVYTTGIPYQAREQRVDLKIGDMLKTFYFHYIFTPLFDSNGQVYGVMNTAADVTDLVTAKKQVEQSEANFRSMIVQAPVAMCIMLGPNFVVDLANDAMIELWGKPKNEVLHKPVSEGFPEARAQGLEQLLHGVYTTGALYRANERPVELLRNGSLETIYQNFVYEAYRDGDDDIVGVLAISVDVTEQVLARHKTEELVARRTQELAEANASLMRSNEDLRRSNASLEEFAFAASHDLKEPVRKVLSFQSRLRKELADKLNDKENYMLDRMEQAGLRMQMLIDDLLRYSHMNKDETHVEEIDLNQKIALVLGDLELKIEEKQAKIYYSELPTIKGHRRQIQQLFQNLIANSLKFTRPGVRPEIRIAATTVSGRDTPLNIEPGKCFHQIEVSDNGIGFEEKYREKIFNMFQRLHARAEYEGTGIGLSIVKKVIDNHNGYIWAESEVGAGTTFRILLPC